MKNESIWNSEVVHWFLKKKFFCWAVSLSNFCLFVVRFVSSISACFNHVQFSQSSGRRGRERERDGERESEMEREKEEAREKERKGQSLPTPPFSFPPPFSFLSSLLLPSLPLPLLVAFIASPRRTS